MDQSAFRHAWRRSHRLNIIIFKLRVTRAAEMALRHVSDNPEYQPGKQTLNHLRYPNSDAGQILVIPYTSIKSFIREGTGAQDIPLRRYAAILNKELMQEFKAGI